MTFKDTIRLKSFFHHSPLTTHHSQVLSSPFQQKLPKLGKPYQEKRMIGKLRMPGKVVKVCILDWPME
jgi:hypothetical protein